MNQLSRNSRLPTTDPIAISKIYPTPPSVETTDKRYEETEMMVEGHSVDLWDRQVSSHCQQRSCTVAVLAYESPIPHVNPFLHVHVYPYIHISLDMCISCCVHVCSSTCTLVCGA